MYDVQRAGMLKRMSAALFDFILLLVAVTGAALLVSSVLGFDAKLERFETIRETYFENHDLNVDRETYDKYTEEEKAAYEKRQQEANEALSKDQEASQLYGLLFNYILIIITFAILIGHLILEFIVPLILKNGQTFGKKIFGVGLMRVDGVRISALQMFVRSVLGKFTVETMIPVFVIIMLVFGITGIVGLAVLVILGLAQIVLIITDRMRTPIHDKLAATVAVDIASQMIFDSPEARVAYQKKLHDEATEMDANSGGRSAQNKI